MLCIVYKFMTFHKTHWTQGKSELQDLPVVECASWYSFHAAFNGLLSSESP